MNNSIVQLILIFGIARAELLFSSAKASDCVFRPYKKEKNNRADVFEDSAAKLPYAMAVGDGLGGTKFNSLFIANAATTRTLRSLYKKYPQGFFRGEAGNIRAAISEAINQEITILNSEFREMVKKVASDLRREEPKSKESDSIAATTFMGAFLERRESKTLIHFIQRGDSMGVLFRLTKVVDSSGTTKYIYKPVYKSREQQFCFNGPFNIGDDESCRPESLSDDFFEVQRGDMVWVASDGFWDNCHLSVATWFFNAAIHAQVHGKHAALKEKLLRVVKHAFPEPELFEFGMPSPLPPTLMISPKTKTFVPPATWKRKRAMPVDSIEPNLREALDETRDYINRLVRSLGLNSRNLEEKQRVFPEYPEEDSSKALLQILQRPPREQDPFALGIANPPFFPPAAAPQKLARTGFNPNSALSEVSATFRGKEPERESKFSRLIQQARINYRRKVVEASNPRPVQDESPLQAARFIRIRPNLNNRAHNPEESEKDPSELPHEIAQDLKRASTDISTDSNDDEQLLKPFSLAESFGDLRRSPFFISSIPHPKLNPHNERRLSKKKPQPEKYGPFGLKGIDIFGQCTQNELFGEQEIGGLSDKLLPECFLGPLVDQDGLTEAEIFKYWERFDPRSLSSLLVDLATLFAKDKKFFSPFLLNAYRNKEEYSVADGGKMDDIMVVADLLMESQPLPDEPLEEVLAELDQADKERSDLLEQNVRSFYFPGFESNSKHVI